MSFTLSEIVPWGRSYDEYVGMFSLSNTDLKRRILGCGDGPASFNSILTSQGGSVVSIDPVYCFSADEIKKRIDETRGIVLDQTRKNREEFVWENISSVEELGKIRMSAMSIFLEDFEKGRSEGRYLPGELPHLTFRDDQFDLALCSHFLFLYSGQRSAQLHIDSIKEMCRVAGETRIFPLLELGSGQSRHLEPVMAALAFEHYQVEIRQVAYQFQKGGNEMMVVQSPADSMRRTSGKGE